MWQALEDTRLTLAGSPEEAGGSGGDLAAAADIAEKHRLRLTTTRLWSWREEDGPAAECFAELGRAGTGRAARVHLAAGRSGGVSTRKGISAGSPDAAGG